MKRHKPVVVKAETMRRTRRRNPGPGDQAELKRAKAMSARYNGPADAAVIELPKKQRELSRYLVPLGRMPELDYETDSKNKKGGYVYVHKAGDRGMLKRKSKRKPMLAIDPATRRPVIVPMGSPVRTNADGWLIG